MIQTFVVLWLATGLASAIPCPDGPSCPDESTCCKKADGSYACCLEPMAVCCSDLLHCCPANTTCDLAHSACVASLSSVPWVKKIPAIQTGTTMWEEAKAIPLVQAGTPNAVTENVCLDNAECPPEYTCMPTSRGFYGCCPHTEATICKDWEHCCPKGYECDLIKAKCRRTGVREEELPLVSGVGNLRSAESELCGNMSCSVGYTCCTSKDFGWGCCPMKDAVCCDDDHCCPKDFKCNKARKTCIRPIDENVKAIICPDGASECPDGSTCCLLPDEQWGCCPLQKAVCCKDRLHCCPSETKCDLKQSKCVSQYGMVEMWKKFPAHRRFAMKNTEDHSVQCNETVACPDDNTCCKLASGDFGCCPLPNAVCCADHVHCCPNGFKCNPAGGCSMEGISIPWMTKTPAIVQSTERDVQCNDTMHCPADNTCCKKTSGDWACCPSPQAVCCDDHVHCCPNGYTCSVQIGMCQKKGSSIPMVLKLTASVEDHSVPCNETVACPDDNTCCKLASGDFGCCPLPNAVCCADHVHCCPNGSKCDPDTGGCSTEDTSIPLMAKTPAIVKSTERDVQCNDTMHCPADNTCCKKASGDWACCPSPQAVCCEDHVHCCPNGYTCSVQIGMCQKKGSSIPMVLKLTASVEGMEDHSVQCNETVACPDDNTCCKLASGDFGCCPLPNAVCCADHVHCCPNGSKCDPDTGGCSTEDTSIPWMAKTPAIVKSTEKDVQCNDTMHCPADNTCCKKASGGWGCCPIPQAVCCEDHLHCCPNGYTCNVQIGLCQKKGSSIPMVLKLTASVDRMEARMSDVHCDDVTTCSSGNTCCRNVSGGWGCCPLPQAVCCEDHIHCCPAGYNCDVQRGSCEKSDALNPLVIKKSTVVKETLQGRLSVVWCDATASCPTNTTCCKMSSGLWTCCPLPQAVCCEDHVHCCPNGYTCDVKAGLCHKGSISIPLVTKMPTIVKGEALDVQCDDDVKCPSGMTCCRTPSGQWSCCPLPQAVCCEDHIHCCPAGYNCDVQRGSCEKSDALNPLVIKKSAVVKETLQGRLSVVWCDATASCPTNTTCCKMSSGLWTCCPLPQAVCCEDHVHCCPNGYTCDVKAGLCHKGSVSIPLVTKMTTIVKGEALDVQCDDDVKCPSGMTCCRTSSGQWSCCPLPQAVCCTDKVHCCPNGYTCDVEQGSCQKNAGSFSWTASKAAMMKSLEMSRTLAIKCDETVSCPAGSTCCQRRSGSWGCCPLTVAVCCEDHEHCCPNGYTCNVRAGTCEKQSLSVPWEVKQSPLSDVKCDDTFRCQSPATCCKIASGSWACCPYEQATCCEDKLHCCPNGYTCNGAVKACTIRPRLSWDLFFSKHRKAFNTL